MAKTAREARVATFEKHNAQCTSEATDLPRVLWGFACGYVESPNKQHSSHLFGWAESAGHKYQRNC